MAVKQDKFQIQIQIQNIILTGNSTWQQTQEIRITKTIIISDHQAHTHTHTWSTRLWYRKFTVTVHVKCINSPLYATSTRMQLWSRSESSLMDTKHVTQSSEHKKTESLQLHLLLALKQEICFCLTFLILRINRFHTTTQNIKYIISSVQ